MSGIRYFAYISAVKVAQLYDQISDLSDVTEKYQVTSGSTQEASVTGGLRGLLSGEIRANLSGARLKEISGTRSDVQKLQALLAYIDEREEVADLNDLCRQGSGARLQAFAYAYRGEFRVGRDLTWASNRGRPHRPELDSAIRAMVEQEGQALTLPEHSFATESDTAILESKCFNYTIDLACSLKHFTHMGSHRADDKLLVHSHSGNHHFFSGKTSAFLEGLLFITAVHSKTIVGSPLFLNYYVRDGLTL